MLSSSFISVAGVKEVKNSDAIKQIVKAKPTIVMMHSLNCGHCVAAKPKIKEMATRHPGVNFVLVETVYAPDMAREHDIRGVPTFLIYEQGATLKNPKKKIVGAHLQEIEDLAKMLSNKPATRQTKEDEEEAAPKKEVQRNEKKAGVTTRTTTSHTCNNGRCRSCGCK